MSERKPIEVTQMPGEKAVQVTAKNGITFTVRRLDKGDRYGLDDCLVHDKEKPLIEFYDTRYPHTKYGQFVSRYYMDTIFDHSKKGGLNLDGGIPCWQMDQAPLQAALQSLTRPGEIHHDKDWEDFGKLEKDEVKDAPKKPKAPAMKP